MEQVLQKQHKLIDEQYKDAHPLKTVEKIRAILSSHGIETVETWFDSNVPHCFILSVAVKGIAFRSTGKGLTKEFALASAYGELMERMQLGFVGSLESQKNGRFAADDNIGTNVEPEILLKNRHWYEKWSEQLYAATGKRLSPEQIIAQITEDGKVPVLPVYNITKRCAEHFPKKIRKAVYGSNGCAAGNTLEEAIVQAIGEIVERHNKLVILSRNTPVPDIPEEVLQKFETAYKIISYLRDRGLRIYVKDCSLGEKFPVVCVCCIDSKTGRYHTHFGANPVLEIALERALTESFQGRTADNFVDIDNFIYNGAEVLSEKNLLMELIQGVSEKTPDFFLHNSKQQWNSQVGFSGSNNRELLLEAVDFFHEQGYEILIQEGSCLGFPTCRVLIPGYSEQLIYRLDFENDTAIYEEHTTRTYRNPAAADFEDYLGMLLYTEQRRKLLPKGYRKGTFGYCANLSAQLSPQEDSFLKDATCGYVYYAMGRYTQAIQCAKQMIMNAQASELESVICLKRYLEMVDNGYEPDRIAEILTFFHQQQTVENLYASIDEGNPFGLHTLHCEMICDENCRLYGSCGQKKADYIVKLIADQTKKLDFDRFSAELNSFLDR